MALQLTQEAFGDVFGVTKRTVQRWEERGAILIPDQVDALARAVYPVQPDLAAEVAASCGTTLERLGVVPAPDGTTAHPLAAVESIVRAAAETIRVSPDAIRPALAAAFARAGELGLDMKTVADALTPRDET